MEVGQSIKKIREWRNYSQRYMAEQLAMTQQNYAKYESGQTEIGVSKIKKIAEILKVPIAYLFELDEKTIFNNYQDSVVNSGEGNTANMLRDPELLQELKGQYTARIEDLKKEIEHLRNTMNKILESQG